jgi:hypothetical protein
VVIEPAIPVIALAAALSDDSGPSRLNSLEPPMRDVLPAF